MDKKVLYMIGNSHIDPVWFWDWDEGMQEVKATFASALDRMNEFPQMKFTATSSAFFEWIEQIHPEMFKAIQKRVEEERWEITGGWYIEPDCHLPTGEAFVRQGLYAQRFFKSRFNKYATIGSNVDGFGHSVGLPQILKKSGMNHYVSMRTRSKDTLFHWESKDGSSVETISLPSEYTTWFYETTKKGMQDTLAAVQNFHGLPCCYGVGNHGGGPTIANVNSIKQLQNEMKDTDIRFSTFGDFFNQLSLEEKNSMPVHRQGFEKINVGCYSIDSEFKQMNRLTEKRLSIAEAILSIERFFTGSVSVKPKKMEKLWKGLLFNQFHDTLGGTAIKAARDEAIMQLSAVNVECKRIWATAIQNIVNTINTTGEGFPLFLFNPTSIDYDGPMHVELNWFCKDDLKLTDYKGNEISYQRVHTQAKVRNYNLGGRRGLVFNAKIPALGFAVYRTISSPPQQCSDARAGNFGSPYILENKYVKASFDIHTGRLSSLIEKESGFESLRDEVSFDIWIDQRDSWGGLQGRPFHDTHQKFELIKLETIEDGNIRKVIRGEYRYNNSLITQLFMLHNESKEIIVENHVQWNEPWHLLKYRIPINIEKNQTRAEGSYTMLDRQIEDSDEYYMHRFLDVSDQGQGLLFANDSKYAFNMDNQDLLVTILRSSIYAQGNGKNWYEPLEYYEYTDIGKQKFTFVLKPHMHAVSNRDKYYYGYLANSMNLYLADHIHGGEKKCKPYLSISVNRDNVIVSAIKQAEADEDWIVRLLEVDGIDSKATLTINGIRCDFTIGHDELKTLKINLATGRYSEVNLIEEK